MGFNVLRNKHFRPRRFDSHTKMEWGGIHTNCNFYNCVKNFLDWGLNSEPLSSLTNALPLELPGLKNHPTQFTQSTFGSNIWFVI